MPDTSKLFAALIKYDRQDLPMLARDIDNGHPTANTKDRMRDLHKMLSVVVRYLVIDGSQSHGVDLEKALAPASGNQASAQLPIQHFPASAVPALGAPPMTHRQVTNVIVGSEIPVGNGTANPMQEETDPDPSDVLQIFTKRNGATVVIPPAGSKAPKKVFPPGQGVDATYIAKYDNPQSTESDPLAALA